MNWTDERVERLKKLWADGLSASQIASDLGGVSRNAVVGKVHRLRLSGRGRTSSAPARPKKIPYAGAERRKNSYNGGSSENRTEGMGLKPQVEVKVVARVDVRTAENNIVPISRNLKLVELSDSTCKWPNGDPQSEDFCFCGNDSGDSEPYCNYHSRLAYQPVSERQRLR